jgi:hypothetical protein
MNIEQKLRLLLDKTNGRVISVSPQEGFVPPHRITIIDATGFHNFEPKDWSEVDWTGALPKGLHAQTGFLFRYENGKLEEAERRTEPEPVII